MDPNTAMETIGESAKAATKLGEIIEKIFGPCWTRKQADADEYADQKKLQTIRENPDMEIIYVDGKLNARQRTQEALAFHAEQRMLADAVRQEENIESILEVASLELSQAANVSDEPVDNDWITRFFNIAKDISNEEMQYVWGKLLAGEIKKPRTFSVRTLEVLKNLTQQEAISFDTIAPFVLRCPADKGKTYYDYFIFSVDDSSAYYNIDFPTIHTLSDAGLLSENSLIGVGFALEPNESEAFQHSNMALKVENISKKLINVTCPAYILSTAGAELLSIINKPLSNCLEYLTSCQRVIEAENPNGLQITIVNNDSEIVS